MDTASETYEELRGKIADIGLAPDPAHRALTWATSGRVLSVARDPGGRVEVFVAGERLHASTQAVRDVLEHNVWKTEGGTDIAANRVVLPAGEHFDQFAALLCVELVDHGLAEDPQRAFSAVEPLIELALTRDLITDPTLTGLIGELALLENLLAAVSPKSTGDVLLAWAGSTPSARDFQLGSVGVEVKTTQGASSVHHVEGVHQVELGHSNKDVAETSLFMLSLGIGWLVDDDDGSSLPELVDRVLDLIPNLDNQLDLMARIKEYGGDSAIGYDHGRDRLKARYATRFYFRFERLYDLTDDRLKFLNSTHLIGLSNVDPGSVAFRVILQDRVRGDLNPLTTWDSSSTRILDTAGYTRR